MVEPFTIVYPLADWMPTGGWLDVYSNGAGGFYQHAGEDGVPAVGPAAGALVIACQSGKALVNHSGDGWGNGSFGSCVRIDHPQGDGSMWSISAHLEQFSIMVEDGEPVQQGQPIGRIGLTGLTTGYHVHFALQSGGGGNFDPMRYLEGGVWKMGNPGIRNPADYLAAVVGPPAPVPSTESLLLQAIARIVALEAALARVDNQAIVLGPDGQGYGLLDSVRSLNAAIRGHVDGHQNATPVADHLHGGVTSGQVLRPKG